MDTTLATLSIGDCARILRLEVADPALARQLEGFGLAPGARLTLLAKWPGCIVRCDETEIALEWSVALRIYVVRPGFPV